MRSLDEKRGTQSRQTLKAGTISFDGSGIDCLVRKMSGYGANLEVESQIGIPKSFDLVIATEQQQSSLSRCLAKGAPDRYRVRLRPENAVGIKPAGT